MKSLKDIVGNDKFYADSDGNIFYINGTVKKKLHQIKSGSVYRVSIHGIKYTVARLIYVAFIGPIESGYCVVHKSVDRADNSVNNLKLVALKDTSQTSYHRKPVAKLNADGDVIEFYSSITEAAKSNFMSYNAVFRRCQKLINDPFLRSEFNFVYTT